LKPFQTPGDLSTPNDNYFARCDQIIRSAALQGITVILDPIETGSFMGVMLDNGPDKCRAYGRYLGARYKDFDNIIWMSGNDYQNWQNYFHDLVVKAVASGIRETDPRHIHTLELNYYLSSSLDNANWADLVTLNAAYTYYPTYAEVLRDYSLTPPVPVFMIEADYEFENGTDAERLRRQEYWSFLAGACGHVYGNYYVWPMRNGWKSNLTTTGAIQLGYCKSLLQSHPWYFLIPDQGHILVTSGFGTFSAGGEPHSSISESDYVTAASTADGRLALVYVPSARTMAVDLTRFTGSVTARWYDPTTGLFRAITGSPFPNTQPGDFVTPGTHSDGPADWVLVLERL
jgi:hypothetical protein